MSDLPSGQDWYTYRIMEVMREDARRLEEKLRADPLQEVWRDHLRKTIEILTRLADDHQADVLRGLPEPIEGEPQRPPRALAVSDAS